MSRGVLSAEGSRRILGFGLDLDVGFENGPENWTGLDHALLVGGLCTLAGLLLPTGIEAEAPVWWFHVAATSAGAWAVGAQLGGAALLLALSLLRLRKQTKARVGLITTVLIAIGIASSPDLRGALFGVLPAAVGQGGFHIALGLAALVTALRLRTVGAPRRLGITLLLIAAGLFAALYISEGPAGTIGRVAKESLHSLWALHPMHEAWPAHLTRLVLTALWAGIFLVSARAVLARPRPTHGWATWIVLIFALSITTVGIKSAIATGQETQGLLAVRTVVLVGGLSVLWAFVTTEIGTHLWRNTAVSAAILAGAGVLGLPQTQVALQRSQTCPPPVWQLDRPKPSLRDLYADALPAMVVAADRQHEPQGRENLERAGQRARQLAGAVPALEKALHDLERALTAPDLKRRRIVQLAERINRINRRTSLPFFLDLQVVAQREPKSGRRFVAHLKTYRIEHAHRFDFRDRPAETLWVRRLDRLNLADEQLGWTDHHAHHGVVVLDAVEHLWRKELGPALAEGVARHRTGPYRRHAAVLLTELAAAVEKPAAHLITLARCTARPHTTPCRRQRLEFAVLRALSQKVEAHEIQHVLDGGAPPSLPDALSALMAGYSADALRAASAELSAYLAEISRSRLSRLALAHLIEHGRYRPMSAEGFASRVALAYLTQNGALSEDALIHLPSPELSRRAQDAWEDIFRRPLETRTPEPSLAMASSEKDPS